MVDILEMEEWVAYTLELHDCCIEGYLHGVFIGYEYEDDDEHKQFPTLLFDFGAFPRLYEQAVTIEETVFFHQLSTSDILEYSEKGYTWNEIANKHPKPQWCGMFDAVAGAMGCWSLMSYKIENHTSCSGCDFRGERK